MAEEKQDNTADNDWEYPRGTAHNQRYIKQFMNWFHETDMYDMDTTFQRNILLSIWPIHIKQWIAYETFGDPNGPNEAESSSFHCKTRASTLKQKKKGVSFFMPNKHADWIDGHGGNPMKSSLG